MEERSEGSGQRASLECFLGQASQGEFEVEGGRRSHEIRQAFEKVASGRKIKVSERSENSGRVWEDFRLIWRFLLQSQGKARVVRTGGGGGAEESEGLEETRSRDASVGCC